jgi:hypothetical protein
MPATERRHWNFQEAQAMQVQFRDANALEYIAYYLDLIEQHLARSVDTNEKIVASLGAISHRT